MDVFEMDDCFVASNGQFINDGLLKWFPINEQEVGAYTSERGLVNILLSNPSV